MRVFHYASSAVSHALEVSTQALLIAAIVALTLLALSPVYRPANVLVGTGHAAAGAGKGWIDVSFGTSGFAPASSTSGSIFTSHGCGFRSNSNDYYMVVRGPAPDTASLAYWVDPFAVDSNGCGSSTVSWTSSGVPGDFQVWVVRSPSGNPWQAQPASNVVTVTITSP